MSANGPNSRLLNGDRRAVFRLDHHDLAAEVIRGDFLRHRRTGEQGVLIEGQKQAASRNREMQVARQHGVLLVAVKQHAQT